MSIHKKSTKTEHTHTQSISSRCQTFLSLQKIVKLSPTHSKCADTKFIVTAVHAANTPTERSSSSKKKEKKEKKRRKNIKMLKLFLQIFVSDLTW